MEGRSGTQYHREIHERSRCKCGKSSIASIARNDGLAGQYDHYCFDCLPRAANGRLAPAVHNESTRQILERLGLTVA